MERECFEDNDVASILNNGFISIKADREERPDIDAVYMSVCQALTGSGGWPLTIVMTPDKKPFFAGTYFPKTSKWGIQGLINILDNIQNIWTNEKEQILENSQIIYKYLKKNNETAEKSKIDDAITKQAYFELSNSFDVRHGGFGTQPKFPTPHNLTFLMRFYKKTNSAKVLKMVEKTLVSMYKGGIFDHIGFGFSRYSTDSKWLVPHFEKMLYDNALLAIAYSEAYSLTKNTLFKDITGKIFSFILRDMTSENGGFFSALDADSEGVEGKYYLWAYDELNSFLSNEELKLCEKYYGITSEGNFENKNIFNMIDTDISKIEQDQPLKIKLEKIRSKIFEKRQERIAPFKDEKILLSWNGLMIAAFSYAGRVFNCDKYISHAKSAVDFILNNMVNNQGKLSARYKDGHLTYEGYLNDYAFFIWGLIELYQATFNPFYLKKALEQNEQMLNDFYDEQNHGLYLYSKKHKEILMRTKEIYDGAMPSGNSVAAVNMLRLSHFTKDLELEKKAEQIFYAFGSKINKNPSLYTHLMTGMLLYKTSSREYILAGDTDNFDLNNLIKEINKKYLPFTTIILNTRETESLIPSLKGKEPIGKSPTIYACENFACKPPTNDIALFLKNLQ